MQMPSLQTHCLVPIWHFLFRASSSSLSESYRSSRGDQKSASWMLIQRGLWSRQRYCHCGQNACYNRRMSETRRRLATDDEVIFAEQIHLLLTKQMKVKHLKCPQAVISLDNFQDEDKRGYRCGVWRYECQLVRISIVDKQICKHS